MKTKTIIGITILWTVSLVFRGFAIPVKDATAVDLPKILNFAGYGVGSVQHSMFLALSKGIKASLPGVEPRHLSSTRSQVSIEEIKNGNAHYLFTTSPNIMNRGTQEYTEIGPQKVRVVWGHFEFANGLMVRGDSGIRTCKDLKGKRVGFYEFDAGWQVPQTAMLEFCSLTYNDVVKVPFPGGMQGAKGVLEGKNDCSIFNPQGSLSKELESSKYGIYWVPMPAADKTAWDRLRAEHPQYFPLYCNWGSAKNQPFDAMGMSYHIITMANVSDDIVYATVKALEEGHDAYKDIDIGGLFMGRMSLKATLNPDRTWCPMHPGLVRYAKEKGVWTPDLEKLQAEKLKAEEQYIKDFQAKKK